MRLVAPGGASRASLLQFPRQLSLSGEDRDLPMPDLSGPGSPSLARLASYAKNLLTAFGFVLTTVSGIGLAVFLILHALGYVENPYIGLFGLSVLPAVFVAGLLAMPAGMLLRRRKLRRRGELDGDPAWPRLD